MTACVTIARLGQRGEGVAETAGGRVYLPYTLPGEQVTADIAGERGTLVQLLQPSAERIEPICGYFTRCGGCAVQHASPASYAAWKRDLLQTTLAKVGLGVEVAPLVEAHGSGRRRATFHARIAEDGTTQVGFMRARAHAIVPIEACPILDPGLAGALPAARAIARTLAGLGKPLDILATATDAGLDIDLRGAGKLGDADQRRLGTLAVDHDLARLSNHGVIVLERRRPSLRMGLAALEPPAGAFLQATAAGETALAERVVAGLDGARRIADLFAGVGTFALRLAATAEVTAYDTEGAALESLSKAARDAQGVRPVRVETRNLHDRPLQPDEFAGFDAVVLDPPRAGAEAQMRTLARSVVPRVASVACDPQSFARDAAILAAAGYEAEIVEPIDQFRYSSHLEIFSLFRRAAPKKKRRLLG